MGRVTDLMREEKLDPVSYAQDSSGNVIGLVGSNGNAFSQSNRLGKKSFTGTRAVAVQTTGTITNHASGDTYQTVMELDAPIGFDRIRVAIPNNQTTGTITVGPFIAAVGTSISNPNSPSGSWTAVLFSGAATVTLTNATSAADPTYTWSDWLNISSVDRADVVGALPLIFLRAFYPSATTSYGVVTPQAAVSGWLTRATHKASFRFHTGVNGVTTPANFTATFAAVNHPFAFVQFASRGKTITVYGCGDSIMGGYGATIPGESHVFMAAEQASTATAPLSYVNGGWPSQGSTTWLLRAERVIPILLPDIAVYSAFSPNDGTPAQSVVNVQLQNLSRFLILCQNNNVVPIILTGLPDDNLAWSAAQDAFRTGFNTLLKTFPSTVVADVATLAGNGASPELFKAGYTTDNTHPNDAGNTAMTPAILAAIQTIISL